MDPQRGLCYCDLSISLGKKVNNAINIKIGNILLMRMMDQFIRLFHFSRSAMISSLQFGQGGVFLAELMGKISLRFWGFKYWSDFVTA